MAAVQAVPAPGRPDPGRAVEGAAFRALGAMRPTRCLEPSTGGILVREPGVEGAQREGRTAHAQNATCRHYLRQHDSSGELYRCQTLSCSGTRNGMAPWHYGQFEDGWLILPFCACCSKSVLTCLPRSTTCSAPGRAATPTVSARNFRSGGRFRQQPDALDDQEGLGFARNSQRPEALGSPSSK